MFCYRGLNFIKPRQIPTDRLEGIIGLIRPWEKATHQRNIYHRNLPLSEPKGKYSVFTDITAAIFASQNNETAAMLVSQSSPLGFEFFSYGNAFFFSNKFA